MNYYLRVFIIITSFWITAVHAIDGVQKIDPGRIKPDVGQLRAEPKLQPKPVAQPAIKGNTAKQKKAIKFNFKGFIIEGATVFTPEDLMLPFLHKIDTKVTFGDLQAIAGKMTAKYRNEGFVLSRVYLPPQDVKDGKVLFKVLEGAVDKIIIAEKNLDYRKKIFKQYEKKIINDKPFKITTLQRYAGLGNELPGTKLEAVIMPSKTRFGFSDILFTTKHKPYELFASADNFAGQRYGYEQTTLGGYVNYDFMPAKTGFVTKNSKKRNALKVFNFIHQHKLNSEGLELQVMAQTVNTKLASTTGFDDFVYGKSRMIAINLMYPLTRNLRQSLTLVGTLDGLNSQSIQAVQPFMDKIRSIRLGVNFEAVDAWRGSNMLNTEVSYGLRTLGAMDPTSQDKSRGAGKVDYAKFNINAVRVQYLSNQWSILTGLQGQLSASDLLSPEEFGFGGREYGRGYGSSTLVGEQGLAIKLELRRNARFKYIENLQMFTFYDLGVAWNNSGQKQVANGILVKRASAASAGLGVKLGFNKHVSGMLQLAKPLTFIPAENLGKNPRVYLSLNLNV